MDTFIWIVSALAVIHVALGEDKEMSRKAIFCKVLGRSGKILIGSHNVYEIETDPSNQIVIEFDELKELDSSGNEVGKTGAQKHSFNSFASQDFTFSALKETTYQNINVSTFDFTATLVETASLIVDVFIFKEEGTIDLDGERTEVHDGDVKFSIKLANWKFCGTGGNDVSCRSGNSDEIGENIEFAISIKGKGNPEKKSSSSTSGDNYNLGAGSKLILSKKVYYDNFKWENMTTGFPKLTTQGSKELFLFRFRKFTASAYYDPQIKYGGGAQGSVLSNLSIVFSCIVALASTLFLMEKSL